MTALNLGEIETSYEALVVAHKNSSSGARWPRWVVHRHPIQIAQRGRWSGDGRTSRSAKESPAVGENSGKRADCETKPNVNWKAWLHNKISRSHLVAPSVPRAVFERQCGTLRCWRTAMLRDWQTTVVRRTEDSDRSEASAAERSQPDDGKPAITRGSGDEPTGPNGFVGRFSSCIVSARTARRSRARGSHDGSIDARATVCEMRPDVLRTADIVTRRLIDPPDHPRMLSTQRGQRESEASTKLLQSSLSGLLPNEATRRPERVTRSEDQSID
jgi:hypothetical protein